jgi:hypothetical protein
LVRERLRLTVRLIACEEELEHHGMSALPPAVMTTLRVLSDFQEAHKRHTRILACDIEYGELVTYCGHRGDRIGQPVVAVLRVYERDAWGMDRGVFCSARCAKGRQLLGALHRVRDE